MENIAGIIYWEKQKPNNNSATNKISNSCISNHLHITHQLVSDNESFFHLNSTTTPKENISNQQITIYYDRYTVMFSGRIDNRSSLSSALSGVTTNSKSDSLLHDTDLAIKAFLKWGNHCATKFLGDFCFIIWDKKSRAIYCCRDQMGVKPFYYFQSAELFVFSTNLKFILALEEIQKIPNNERIADFLVCGSTENKATFYKNIYKLPPAHYMVADKSNHQEILYWQPTPYDLNCKNDKDYEEHFYSIFKESVASRSKDHDKVGSFLSGGLDSSSITCMAAGPLKDQHNNTLNTYSAIFNHLPECDEQAFFTPIFDQHSIKANFLICDEISASQAFDTISAHVVEPFDAPHIFMQFNLLTLAQKHNIKIMLDGHDGDSAVSYGFGMFPELAAKGKIASLLKELLHANSNNYKKAIRSVGILYGKMLQKNLFKITRHPHIYKNQKILTSKLFRTTNTQERCNALQQILPHPLQSEQEQHFLKITQPFHSNALEFFDSISTYFNISNRYPFFDIRLINFCLSLPTNQKFRNGYPRDIVRRSLRDILPESIRTRRNKTNFTTSLVNAYLIRDRIWFDETYHNLPKEVFQYVEQQEVKDIYSNLIYNYKTNNVLTDLQNMLRIFSLARWLRKMIL